MKQTYYSNGKLLLTGEYVVLDGATALAVPTKFGQSLKVEKTDKAGLYWESFDKDNFCWFKAHFELADFRSKKTLKEIKTLSNILKVARNLNPQFLTSEMGYSVTTHLDFDQSWGLGTSSTLINNIAQWASINAFELLEKSFGGSGYDIAAAQHNKPIFYKKTETRPEIREVHLNWDFKDAIFFVHLNQKQDSKEGIAAYKNSLVNDKQLQQISDLSTKLLMCYTLGDFEALLNAHEVLISEIIQQPTVKSRLFSDYPKTIKSLGAWGGDFVLVTGTKKDMRYFKSKGYETIIPFEEMVLKNTNQISNK